MVAEAEETERLRAELDRTREDSERLLAAERAEVARLREELLSSEVDEAGRRGVAAHARARHARPRARARDVAQPAARAGRRCARSRPSTAARLSSSTANGTLAMDDAAGAARASVRTPEGTQRRVDAARAASAQRVPRSRRRRSLWAVRILAALLVAVLGVALVILVSHGDRDALTTLARPAPRVQPGVAVRGGARRRGARPRRALAAAAVGARLRPDGVGGVGARGRPARARHHQRPVVEAVPGAVHDAARAVRRRRAGAVADRRPRRRAARARGRVRARAAPRRALGGRRGRGRDGALALVGCSTPRSATPRACSPRRSCGRSSRTSAATAARALALLTAAALMRPEVWPFLGAYGVWLWRTRPGDAGDRRPARVVPLLWFGPDLLGAGGALDASKTGARHPQPGQRQARAVPGARAARRHRDAAHAARR